MGKRAKLKTARREQKKSVPHVVLIAGSHNPGVESEVEPVLTKEKPVFFGVEMIQTPESYAAMRERLRQAHLHVSSPRAPFAYTARMYLLAKKLRIPFDTVEIRPEEDVARVLLDHHAENRLAFESLEQARRGEITEALSTYKLSTAFQRGILARRNEFLAEQLALRAKGARGPIAFFTGAGHVRLVKHLVNRGVKVTLYHRPLPYSLFPGLPAIALGGTTRLTMLRNIFAELLADHLAKQYSISPREIEGVFYSVPGLRKLHLSKTHLEDFFARCRGKTHTQFREHLFDFLRIHGVQLPQSRESFGQFSFSQFRKVKVFEPGKHFVK